MPSKGNGRQRRTTELSQADAAKAISHPLRVQILKTLHSTEEPISPSKLCVLLDQPIGNVSYHIRILHKLGAVKEVKTKQVRGAIEHYYRPTVKIGEIPVERVA